MSLATWLKGTKEAMKHANRSYGNHGKNGVALGRISSKAFWTGCGFSILAMSDPLYSEETFVETSSHLYLPLFFMDEQIDRQEM